MGLQKPLFYEIFTDEPIVDACYDVVEMCFDYIWYLQVYTDGADGNPQISIEASNDKVHWDAWSECTNCVEMTDDSISFYDHYFGAKYIRVCVKANGVTTGTISANINLKGH